MCGSRWPRGQHGRAQTAGRHEQGGRPSNRFERNALLRTHRNRLHTARRDAPASEGGVIRAASRRLWGTLTPVILPPGARATCSHFVCSPPPAPAASLSGLAWFTSRACPSIGAFEGRWTARQAFAEGLGQGVGWRWACFGSFFQRLWIVVAFEASDMVIAIESSCNRSWCQP